MVFDVLKIRLSDWMSDMAWSVACELSSNGIKHPAGFAGWIVRCWFGGFQQKYGLTSEDCASRDYKAMARLDVDTVILEHGAEACIFDAELQVFQPQAARLLFRVFKHGLPCTGRHLRECLALNTISRYAVVDPTHKTGPCRYAGSGPASWFDHRFLWQLYAVLALADTYQLFGGLRREGYRTQSDA